MKEMQDLKDLKDLSVIQGKFNHTYLNGVYLAVNAVPDSYLLLDGMICGFSIMFFIHGTHDLFSDLFRQNAKHRVCCVGSADHAMAGDRSDAIAEKLFKLNKEKDCSVIFLASFPMAAITGVHYGMIIRKVQNRVRRDILEIPSKSLTSDWLDGYAEVLLAMARGMDLKPGRTEPDRAAVVGYLFDRNEGDHTGNLFEINRILNALSLKAGPVWLSGSPFSDLKSVERAGIVISLPYGRRAAREIAGRTKARLIELDLPFGIGNTKEWIVKLARKTGRSARAAAFIREEMKKVIPVTDLVVPRSLAGKRFAFYGDPHVARCLSGALAEIGMEAGPAVLFSSCPKEGKTASSRASSSEIFYEPRYGEVYDLLGKTEAGIHIGNSYAYHMFKVRGRTEPFVEFGYPSFYHHCLTASPFLGFRGFVRFLNRLVNALH